MSNHLRQRNFCVIYMYIYADTLLMTAAIQNLDQPKVFHDHYMITEFTQNFPYIIIKKLYGHFIYLQLPIYNYKKKHTRLSQHDAFQIQQTIHPLIAAPGKDYSRHTILRRQLPPDQRQKNYTNIKFRYKSFWAGHTTVALPVYEARAGLLNSKVYEAVLCIVLYKGQQPPWFY